MINLLPITEKKKLLKESRMRFVVVILWIVLSLEIFAAVAFVPSFYTLVATAKNLKLDLEHKQALAPSGGDDIEKALRKMKAEITLLQLTSATKDIPPSELIDAALKKKPAGVVLRSFAYGQAGGVLSMQFSGVADTREDLLTFQRELKEEPKFSDVKYDESFITKRTAIDFRLTITMK